MKQCPLCGEEYDGSIGCDNDCDTYICGSCNSEWYYNHDGKQIYGHNSNCGSG